jgi:DNA-binding NarL/FixJ family response regulator
MIRSRSAVRLLLDLVESTWSAASPYVTKEIGYHEVTDHLHGTIIQMLAEGLTDDAIARRLGLSVRTCRRHIATLLRNLDAVSRFQAGVRVGAGRQLRTAS